MATVQTETEPRVIFDADYMEQINEQVNDEFDAGYLRVPEERRRLRRYIEFEMLATFALLGHLPNELRFHDRGKMAEFTHENVQIATQLEKRNHEHPRGKKETVDKKVFSRFATLLDHPETMAELYGNVFRVLCRQQIAAYEKHCAESDEYFNRPTSKLLEQLIPVKRRQLQWGEQKYEAMLANLSSEECEAVASRVAAFAQFLKSMGSVDGTESGKKPRIQKGRLEPIPEDIKAEPAFKFDDGYLSPEETKHWREQFPEWPDETHAMLYAYCTEFTVIDQFALITYRAPRDMPLEFFYDCTRQTWDEHRHTSMGHRAMRRLGYDPSKLLLPYRWRAWRQMTVEENYAFMTQTGEACSLAPKHLNRKELIKRKWFHEQTLIEWDISDESQHVRYGGKWTPVLLERMGYKGRLKKFVMNATDKFNWLQYQARKEAGVLLPDEEEPKPYEGCDVSSTFSA